MCIGPSHSFAEEPSFFITANAILNWMDFMKIIITKHLRMMHKYVDVYLLVNNVM